MTSWKWLIIVCSDRHPGFPSPQKRHCKYLLTQSWRLTEKSRRWGLELKVSRRLQAMMGMTSYNNRCQISDSTWSKSQLLSPSMGLAGQLFHWLAPSLSQCHFTWSVTMRVKPRPISPCIFTILISESTVLEIISPPNGTIFIEAIGAHEQLLESCELYPHAVASSNWLPTSTS